MTYVGKKPADIIATAVDTTTGTFSGDLTVDTSTLYVDSTNNRVGIGTNSSLVRDLNINGTAASSKAFVRFTHDGLSSTGLDVGYSSAGYSSIYNAENTPMVFSTNATERMRIDSSGNLLVSTTSNTPATGTNTGIALKSNDSIEASCSGAAPLLLNRTSNDGNIAVFRRDGTAVASIGSRTGSTGESYISLNQNSTGAGLAGGGAGQSILPTNKSGAPIDNSTELGNSAFRFKNIYLSGGVVLDDNPTAVGGDVTSKTLDDYEEGSWTPELTFNQGTTGIVYNSAAGSRSGQYVKIGQFVWLWFYFILSNKGTSTGTAEINGIPFTTANTFYNENGGLAHAYSGFTGLRSNITTLVGGSNRIYLNHADANSGSITAASNLTNSQFTNGAYMRGHVCYKTTQ